VGLKSQGPQAIPTKHFAGCKLPVMSVGALALPALDYPKPPPPSGAAVVGVIGWMASAGLVLP